MLLGFDKLQELVKAQNIIEGLTQEELDKKGGIAFDVRLGEIHEFVGEGFLGIAGRKTPETTLLGKFQEGRSTTVRLKPNKYYLVKTIEKFNCPTDLAFILIPRSTLYRSGLILLSGLGDPGFKGECTFGLVNAHDKPFMIELGTRICNVIFLRVEGKAEGYDGAYQGGKIGAEGRKGKRGLERP